MPSPIHGSQGPGEIPKPIKGDISRAQLEARDAANLLRDLIPDLNESIGAFENVQVPFRRKVDVRRGGGTKDAATPAIHKTSQAASRAFSTIRSLGPHVGIRHGAHHHKPRSN